MTIKMLTACTAAVLISNSGAALAAQDNEREILLEQPPAFSAPVAGDSGAASDRSSAEQSALTSEEDGGDEELEPTVTIKEQSEVTVYEYRLNGLLYGVKVVPKNAPAYYLIDVDGDGLMDWRRSDLASPEINRIPGWVLFRW